MLDTSLNTPLLTPPLNFLSQLLPLVANLCHHWLDLLAVSLVRSVLRMSIALSIRLESWSKILVMDGDHQVHHRR